MSSVVVVDKHGGKFKELHTVGIGREEDEIGQLCIQGRNWIKKHLGIQEIDFEEPDLNHKSTTYLPNQDNHAPSEQGVGVVAFTLFFDSGDALLCTDLLLV